ncbi:MAG: phosphatidate cytidylyltransferase [Nitrospirota bacterium]|nr:phosphatidate cytidylyltransferase [Nitrospirota bacterium]
MSGTRVATSVVLIPLLFIIVWVLPPIYFAGLAVVAAVVGLQEFYGMVKARGLKPLETIGFLLGAVLILEFSRTGMQRLGYDLVLTFSVLAVLCARLFSRRPVEGALEEIAVTLLGVLYVALLFGFQVAIHRGSQGKYWLMFMYLVIWASDTGAYYVGSAFGKHRLYEKISPKKSVEGLAGGVAASVLVAVLCKLWLVKGLGWGPAIALGAVLALVGTVGDLAESLLKRSAGVKDSGALIPGHGGILDRMDSMLFAAPVLYYYLKMR